MRVHMGLIVPSVENPSHSDMNSVFMLVTASCSDCLLCPKKLSTSSMKMMAGWSLWARVNTAVTGEEGGGGERRGGKGRGT